MLVNRIDTLNVLIVDDEPLARMRLRGLLQANVDPKVEVVAEAATATQAQAWLREHACDLVLLDIQMPGPSGLQLAELMQDLPVRPLVVFVTAHAEHALRAFEIDALDYLTKPVRRERLQAALQRVQSRLRERAATQAVREQADAQVAGEFVTVSERGRLLRVPLAEVLYFKAELKYLTLRTAQATHVLEGSLNELEQRWPTRFLRVHRNALVAKDAVRELERRSTSAAEPGPGSEAGEGAEGWALRVAHVNEWLAVSRRQLGAVRDALALRPS